MEALPLLGIWFDPERLDGPAHMARDEALLLTAELPVLRIYRWPSRQLSIGYFCRLAEVQRDYGDAPIVRRWTGGGIVTHGEDWTFSLVIPGGHEPAAELYCRLHRALVATLNAADIPATLSDGNPDAVPGGACFTHPVTSDVMLAGKKIVGGAQRRNRRGVLHQGSLVLDSLPPDFFETFAHRLANTVIQWPSTSEWTNCAKELEHTRYRTREWREKF